MNILWFVLGLVVVIVTIVSVLLILVLSRQPMGVERSSLLINRTLALCFLLISRLAEG